MLLQRSHATALNERNPTAQRAGREFKQVAIFASRDFERLFYPNPGVAPHFQQKTSNRRRSETFPQNSLFIECRLNHFLKAIRRPIFDALPLPTQWPPLAPRPRTGRLNADAGGVRYGFCWKEIVHNQSL